MEPLRGLVGSAAEYELVKSNSPDVATHLCVATRPPDMWALFGCCSIFPDRQ